MEKRTVVVDTSTLSSPPGVTSVTLEIIPDSGFVVAARDFVAGPNPDIIGDKIDSITLSDSESSGGPQNDGSYTANNKVIVTVDFDNDWEPTENITFDIDPSGSATAKHLVPVKLQGTFAVPASPDKVTFTASSVLDFASSGSTSDFYAYDTPGKVVDIMTMTVAATSGDFIDEDPTIAVANSSYALVDNEYSISRSDTFTQGRLVQVVYTVKVKMPSSDRSSDLVTFTGSGEDIPGVDNKIYGFSMDTSSADVESINRSLEITADSGSKFRIKIERGTISNSIFTIDSTDGIYVFDNTKQTISDAFLPGNSTVTYPSEINSDGDYLASVNPYTVDDSGLFSKDIVIPADSSSKLYRFTIIPQGNTIVDPTAVGIDTSPDPDVISFYISRLAEVYIEATYNSENDRQSLTATTEYFNYQGKTNGVNKPAGLANKEVNNQVNTYDYELVITDDVDFHLPNQENKFQLSELNYSKTLNSGIIFDPVITAELKADSNGFNSSSIRDTGDTSHHNANNHETNTAIVLTEQQRESLTNKNSFSLISVRSSFSIVGTDEYFKIKFFTTEESPVYKSQTIRIFSDYQVQGGDIGQDNTTTIAAPAVDRSKLYIKGDNLAISKWGSSNMSIVKQLDTFAFTSSQVINTLDMSLGITQGVRNFVNSVASGIGYVYATSYYMDKLVSNDGGSSFIKQNVTADDGNGAFTTHVKFTVSGAFLTAEDGLPLNFNTSDYELLFETSNFNGPFSNIGGISVSSQPTLQLVNGGGLDRRLNISNFDVVIDFGSTLQNLSTASKFFYNTSIIHKLSNQYKTISDIEEEYFPNFPKSNLATY